MDMGHLIMVLHRVISKSLITVLVAASHGPQHWKSTARKPPGRLVRCPYSVSGRGVLSSVSTVRLDGMSCLVSTVYEFSHT